MKCYVHADHDAVGVCKSCQKGLCRECAVDLGKGLACRGSCEDEAQRLIQFIESNMRLAPVGGKVWHGHGSNLLLSAIACIVLGAVFAIWGSMSGPQFSFIIVVGVVLSGWGILQAVQALRVRAITKAFDQASK